MGKTFVITGLRRKYAELKGELATLPTLPFEESENCMTALRQVGVVLRMFAPNENLSAIPPIRPSKGRGRAWTREALDILRRNRRPLTAREIARQIVAQRRLAADPQTVSSIECSLHATLARLEGRGVEKADGAPKRWAIGA